MTIELTIKNAEISGTMLGREDHGIFTYMIQLDYGDSSGQGFGGYVLDGYDETTSGRNGTVFGCEAIFKLLDILEVVSWEQLKGTPCRVQSDFSHIHRIGNFKKDKWLDLKELANEIKTREVKP